MSRRIRSLTAVALATTLSCTKEQPAPTPPAGSDATTETDASPSSIKTDDLPENLAKRLADTEKKSAEVRARWTPELHDAVTELTSTDYPSLEAALDAILASPHRAPGNAERDQHRHPKETLAFFGLRQDMRVFEYAQGAGWYTEILAPLLAKDGTLVLAGYDGTAEDPTLRFAARTMELFLTSPGNLYEQVETITQTDFKAPPKLGEPDSLDMVLVIRMFHNVERAGMWDSLMPAVHTALKPGGVLGVVQHRATDDADPTASAKTGYLPEPWLVERIESYGFSLEARSDVNANPKDTKDHPKGVWTLPPSLDLGEQDREKYLAIGESDRTTLKFVKVAK